MQGLLKSQGYASERVEQSVARILESCKLGSLATVTPSRGAHVNTVYFCWTRMLDLYFLSDPKSTHGKNLTQARDAAMTVFSTDQDWGDDHAGLQLFGECELVQGELQQVASALYAKRFPAYDVWFRALSDRQQRSFPGRFYVFRSLGIKILDESEFGEEVFVQVEVMRSTR